MSKNRRRSLLGKSASNRTHLVSERLEARVLLSNNPSATTVSPANGATDVALNTSISVDLSLPNGGIQPTTVQETNFYLYQTAFPGDNAKFVTCSIKTTGGGDALLMTPLQNLLPNTSYTVVITAGVTDTNGDTFTPFSESFTTGSTLPPVNQNFAFTQVALPTTNGNEITDMQVGPDGMMYASTETGLILRYTINSDGTLGTPQVIDSLQTANSGNNMLITGFAFDPSFVSNPSAPELWVSDTYYALSGATNAPNFTSKLTVMSGANLQNVTDAVVDLPRSVADHVNDQPVFQPGTHNLFFCQAGQSAYGAPDATWGNRAETLLSSAILEVNTSALNLSGPALNVLTSDVGGTYNPYASGAPVTIYATGIRNSYPLLFDNTGQLWAPSNGSSSGGNAPAGPSNNPPALTDIQQVEEDTMIKVQQGAYYGHPDPVRSQYVLGQGNPTTGGVAGLAFTAYPSGTNPDPNYTLPNFIFGLHVSPDGIVEYEGNAFGGALNGDFIVTAYSAPDNIMVLSRDSNDNIIGGLVDDGSSTPSLLPAYDISGFQQLSDPLSIAEDNKTGYLYVSELGADGGLGSAILLKPSSVQQEISSSQSSIVFNTIAMGNAGAGPATASVTITNLGANALDISSVSIVNNPADAAASADYSITNSSSLPSALSSVGSSMTINLSFTAPSVGLASAILKIVSNDPTTPTLDIPLSGIGTAGTYPANVPSLVQVLRANNIPTIVGAGPDDVNINTVNYPETPDASSTEVTMQQMEAANTSEPVVITPLASFSASASTVSDIGYYTPGNATAKTQVLSVPQADAQTADLSSLGTFSFSPGANPFGLYAFFPGVSSSDYHYSQDALNAALDSVNPRKIRFFPYELSNGTVVANEFVFAVEDSNSPTYNSFDNFVGLISNVTGGVVAPTNLTVSSNKSTAVTLTWTAVADATSYTVAREGPGASTFTPIASSLSTPTYSDSNVTVGQTYQYEVEAVTSLNTSSFTAAVSATPPVTMLPAPGNLQVSSATPSGVVLTWTASTGATNYTILREGAGQSAFSSIATNITALTYTDTTALVGSTYQYEVQASSSIGLSPVSATTSAQVLSTLAITVGKAANKAVQFTNDSGTLTTISLAGPGTAVVDFAAINPTQSTAKAGVVVSGVDISVFTITVSGTTAASVLSITTRGGTNTISLGAISANGSLNAINAPTVALTGALAITGSIKKLTIGSATGDSLTVSGALGQLKVGTITNASLAVAGAIGTVAANAWASSEPISAASIQSFTVRGNAELDLTTQLIHTLRVGVLQNSDISLTGAGVDDLASLNAGGIDDSVIDTAGNIGSIVATTLAGSQIYAGTGATGQAAFPPVKTAFSSTTIASVVLRAPRGSVADTNSSIAAGQIIRASLATIQLSNGGAAFGIEADNVRTLTFINSATGAPVALTKLSSAAIVNEEVAAKGLTLQDFAIDVL